MAVCPNCGNQTGEGAVFCDRCGTRLPQPEVATPAAAPAPAGGSVICPACGAGNVPGEAFCDFCGSPLAAPVPTAEPTPAMEPVSSAEELVVSPDAGIAAEGEGKLTCPACGVEVAADEAFCQNCGASLAQAPITPEAVPEEPQPSPVATTPAKAAEEPASAVQTPPQPVEAPAPQIPAPSAPEPAPPVVETPPLPAAARPTCPICGAEVEAGDAFCSSCGASLKAAAAPTPAPAEQAPPPPAPEPIQPAPVPPPPPPPAPAASGPRLVVSSSGAEIPLPAQEEILIGREDPVSGVYPDVDMTPHGGEDGGVSRRHARLIAEGGNYFVEDLDSTNFTFVNKQKLAPRTRHPLHNGDEIRCGRVAMVFKAS